MIEMNIDFYLFIETKYSMRVFEVSGKNTTIIIIMMILCNNRIKCNVTIQNKLLDSDLESSRVLT